MRIRSRDEIATSELKDLTHDVELSSDYISHAEIRTRKATSDAVFQGNKLFFKLKTVTYFLVL